MRKYSMRGQLQKERTRGILGTALRGIMAAGNIVIQKLGKFRRRVRQLIQLRRKHQRQTDGNETDAPTNNCDDDQINTLTNTIAHTISQLDDDAIKTSANDSDKLADVDFLRSKPAPKDHTPPSPTPRTPERA